MNYNNETFLEFGVRVKAERKRCNYSQEAFIEELANRGVRISRNRLSGIENGKREDFDLEMWIAICDIFKCDMGYLLGEYEETTRNKAFLCQQTGLSEKALDFLLPHSGDLSIGVLNLLLEEYHSSGASFLNVLSSIYNYYNYYAALQKEKETFALETRVVRQKKRAIDPNDWDALFNVEKSRTVSKDKIERHELEVKALRLGVYEAFIAVVDKIVAKQYKSNKEKERHPANG